MEIEIGLRKTTIKDKWDMKMERYTASCRGAESNTWEQPTNLSTSGSISINFIGV